VTKKRLRTQTAERARAGGRGHAKAEASARKVVRKTANPTSDPRRLAATRVQRHGTREELHAAVLTWCRAQILDENPTFDVAGLEADLRDRVALWAHDNDEGFQQWLALRDAMSNALKYLDGCSDGARQRLFAETVAAFFNTPCQGYNSIRDRVEVWLAAPNELWMHGDAPRARLIAQYANAPPNVLWWVDRKPKVRDLSIITLLAGVWPAAAKGPQREVGAARRTVLDVVGAADNAVRATRPGLRSR
jgi:hypothetical protein